MSFFGNLSAMFSSNVRSVAPQEAAQLVSEGKAVLIDVREPDEWEDGVAKPALTIALGDIQSSEAEAQLAKHKDKEIILYCRSGGRSGMAARILAQKGFRTANAGGFRDWERAGLPVRAI
jgi:rhodanese-related sulfurtransferase